MKPDNRSRGTTRLHVSLLLGVIGLSGAGGLVVRPIDRAGPRANRRQEIVIHDMAFDPAILTVTVGDTVVWVNRDLVSHTATADTIPKWDTGSIDVEESAWQVVRQPGVVRYHCTWHPTMRGTLIIR